MSRRSRRRGHSSGTRRRLRRLAPLAFLQEHYWDVQRSALFRSRRELSNEFFVAIIRFGVAENEPSKVLAGRVTGNDLGQERKQRPDEPAMLR